MTNTKTPTPAPTAAPRYIPDTECIQGKCARPTTGCWDECNIKRNPIMYTTSADIDRAHDEGRHTIVGTLPAKHTICGLPPLNRGIVFGQDEEGKPVLSHPASGTPSRDELLPCAFCGGAAKLFSAGDHAASAVNCQSCDAYGPSVVGKVAAIEAWNRRAATSTKGANAEGAAEVRQYRLLPDQQVWADVSEQGYAHAASRGDEVRTLFATAPAPQAGAEEASYAWMASEQQRGRAISNAMREAYAEGLRDRAPAPQAAQPSAPAQVATDKE